MRTWTSVLFFLIFFCLTAFFLLLLFLTFIIVFLYFLFFPRDKIRINERNEKRKCLTNIQAEKKSREAAWINHNKEKAAVKKETLLSGLMD